MNACCASRASATIRLSGKSFVDGPWGRIPRDSWLGLARAKRSFFETMPIEHHHLCNVSVAVELCRFRSHLETNGLIVPKLISPYLISNQAIFFRRIQNLLLILNGE